MTTEKENLNVLPQDESVFPGKSVPHANSILSRRESSGFQASRFKGRSIEEEEREIGGTAEIGIVPSSLIDTSHCK